MQTSAFVLNKFGTTQEAFALEDAMVGPLQSDEVLICSEAFGLNYADVMAKKGLYREAPPLPCILGYELDLSILTKFDEKIIKQQISFYKAPRFYGNNQIYLPLQLDHSIAGLLVVTRKVRTT